MGMSVGSLGGAGGGDVDLDPDLLLLASSPSDIAAAVVAGGAVGVRGGALSRAAAVSAAANAAVQKTATSLFGGMRQKARAFMSAGTVSRVEQPTCQAHVLQLALPVSLRQLQHVEHLNLCRHPSHPPVL